jgi:hypothetical protein
MVLGINFHGAARFRHRNLILFGSLVEPAGRYRLTQAFLLSLKFSRARRDTSNDHASTNGYRRGGSAPNKGSGPRSPGGSLLRGTMSSFPDARKKESRESFAPSSTAAVKPRLSEPMRQSNPMSLRCSISSRPRAAPRILWCSTPAITLATTSAPCRLSSLSRPGV